MPERFNETDDPVYLDDDHPVWSPLPVSGSGIRRREPPKLDGGSDADYARRYVRSRGSRSRYCRRRREHH